MANYGLDGFYQEDPVDMFTHIPYYDWEDYSFSRVYDDGRFLNFTLSDFNWGGASLNVTETTADRLFSTSAMITARDERSQADYYGAYGPPSDVYSYSATDLFFEVTSFFYNTPLNITAGYTATLDDTTGLMNVQTTQGDATIDYTIDPLDGAVTITRTPSDVTIDPTTIYDQAYNMDDTNYDAGMWPHTNYFFDMFNKYILVVDEHEDGSTTSRYVIGEFQSATQTLTAEEVDTTGVRTSYSLNAQSGYISVTRDEFGHVEFYEQYAAPFEEAQVRPLIFQYDVTNSLLAVTIPSQNHHGIYDGNVAGTTFTATSDTYDGSTWTYSVDTATG